MTLTFQNTLPGDVITLFGIDKLTLKKLKISGSISLASLGKVNAEVIDLSRSNLAYYDTLRILDSFAKTPKHLFKSKLIDLSENPNLLASTPAFNQANSSSGHVDALNVLLGKAIELHSTHGVVVNFSKSLFDDAKKDITPPITDTRWLTLQSALTTYLKFSDVSALKKAYEEYVTQKTTLDELKKNELLLKQFGVLTQKNLEQAIKQFGELVTTPQVRDNPDSNFYVAKYYELQKRYPDAYQAYKKVSTRDPNYSQATKSISCLLSEGLLLPTEVLREDPALNLSALDPDLQKLLALIKCKETAATHLPAETVRELAKTVNQAAVVYTGMQGFSSDGKDQFGTNLVTLAALLKQLREQQAQFAKYVSTSVISELNKHKEQTQQTSGAPTTQPKC